MRKGLEPSTSGVTGRHSNQLNYRTKLLVPDWDCKGTTILAISKFFIKFFIVLGDAAEAPYFWASG